MVQNSITKWRSLKITKWRKKITKWRSYYKVAQKNYKVAQLLQSGTTITKWRITDLLNMNSDEINTITSNRKRYGHVESKKENQFWKICLCLWVLYARNLVILLKFWWITLRELNKLQRNCLTWADVIAAQTQSGTMKL